VSVVVERMKERKGKKAKSPAPEMTSSVAPSSRERSPGPELVVAEPEFDLEGRDVGILGPLEAVRAFPRQAGPESFALDAGVRGSAPGCALAVAILLRLGSGEVHRQGLDRRGVVVVVVVFGDDGGGRNGCCQGRRTARRDRQRE
jgi:hypothetical protein